jgi:glycosyltransferase involved in cell wall biosynthesis
VNHVAFVIPGLDRLGGAERQVMLLAKGLARRGWRVSVVALSGRGGDAASELRAAGVEFVTLEMRKGLADPRGWIRFARWLRRAAPDVVHAHLPHATWLVRASRLYTPSRVVLDTIHTSSIGSFGRRLGYRITAGLPDCVTAVSQSAADAYVSAGMVKREGIAVLPNGIETSEWKPDAAVRAKVRTELGLTGELLWLAAGRLEPVKDYPTLLRAMTALPEQARLIIAGSGSLENELHAFSRKLGLAKRVVFLGFQPDVRRWMQAADGFVLSSRWEGLPMSLLEAGACGVGSAATSIPGVREIVVEGETGFLAKAGSASDLGHTMLKWMHLPPDQRAAVGMRARNRIAGQFSLDRALDRWEALYGQLLTENQSPRRRANLHQNFPTSPITSRDDAAENADARADGPWPSTRGRAPRDSVS